MGLKRLLAFVLVLGICAGLCACRRTDQFSPAETAAPEATAEPPIVAVFPEGFVTPNDAAESTAQPEESTDPQTALEPVEGEHIPPIGDEDPDMPEDPGEPAEQDVPEETAAPTQEPEEPAWDDPYTYTTLTNSALRVKFVYPEGWISSPTTEIITMVEPALEGEVAARVSVTSQSYTESKPSTRRLKEHLGEYLRSALSAYNDYKLESTDAASFVGSAGMSATYLAIQGNNYIRGIVYAGYSKATKTKAGRVYYLQFSCEESRFEELRPLFEKLAANVTPTTD